MGRSRSAKRSRRGGDSRCQDTSDGHRPVATAARARSNGYLKDEAGERHAVVELRPRADRDERERSIGDRRDRRSQDHRRDRSRSRGSDRSPQVGRGKGRGKGDGRCKGEGRGRGGGRGGGLAPLPRPGFDDDPRLKTLEDDPRYFEGAQLGKAQKAALGITGLTGRNTASFDPNSTLVRPSMRIMHGPRQSRCGKSLKFDDVVVVPSFLGPDRSGRENLLGDLVEELRTLDQKHGDQNMDLSKLETLQWVLRQASKYFSLADEEKKRGVRLVWYRDRADTQPHLHETANFVECMDKADTCMAILTFGAQREMAWQRVSAEETVYFPLDDAAMFFCGPEVRKHWNFDTKTLSPPREDRTNKGHVAIVLVAASSITTPEQVLAPTPTDKGWHRQFGDSVTKGFGHDSSSTFDASKFGLVSPGKYVRPSMRVITVPSSERYAAPVSNDDVIVVPHFFCPEDDWGTYYKLIEEMRECQARGENRSEWMSWHEGAHLLVQNPTGSATYQRVLDKMCQYFSIKEGNRGTRFNWYRDASDWKPFHHDSAAFNPQRAKNQNCTVGISFGASRELAFRHAKTGELIYFPQTNGMLFYFGRDANIVWQHGINAMPREEQDGKGRISIILWGWCNPAVEEPGSPPMLVDETRPGGYDGRRTDTPCRDFQRGSCKFGDRCRFSHNAAGRRT